MRHYDFLEPLQELVDRLRLTATHRGDERRIADSSKSILHAASARRPVLAADPSVVIGAGNAWLTLLPK